MNDELPWLASWEEVPQRLAERREFKNSGSMFMGQIVDDCYNVTSYGDLIFSVNCKSGVITEIQRENESRHMVKHRATCKQYLKPGVFPGIKASTPSRRYEASSGARYSRAGKKEPKGFRFGAPTETFKGTHARPGWCGNKS